MKPIVYIGLFLSILFNCDCNINNKKWLKGSVNYSGVVVDACTGMPITNRVLYFTVGVTLYHGSTNIQDHDIGQTSTDNNGYFNFEHSYDLTNDYVNNIDYYSISAGGDYPTYNYLGSGTPYDYMNTNNKSQSGIVLKVYPTHDTLRFLNTKGILNPDSTQKPFIYIDFRCYIADSNYLLDAYWRAQPTHPYNIGNTTYANDTCVAVKTTDGFVPILIQYTAVYYRKSGSTAKMYTYNFNIDCKNTPITLP